MCKHFLADIYIISPFTFGCWEDRCGHTREPGEVSDGHTVQQYYDHLHPSLETIRKPENDEHGLLY